MKMKGQTSAGGEGSDEVGVDIGGGSANAVVNMEDGEDESDFGCGFSQGAEKGHGIGPAGDGDGQTQAGTQISAVERWREKQRHSGGFHRIVWD
jgi:hypothetical protein